MKKREITYSNPNELPDIRIPTGKLRASVPMKRCTSVANVGCQCIRKCGSYAFNLYKVGIEQGDRCDVCYWRHMYIMLLLETEDYRNGKK
jgi:hypothetical protein